MVEPVAVTLGEHEYEVVPQRHAKVERDLIGEGGVFGSFEQLQELGDGSQQVTGLIDFLGDRIYDVLRVFIPDLMERYEFQGFATREAFESGDYNEEYDRSPTIPEITVALNAAIDVNGLRFIGKVKDFFDPTLLRSQLNATVARWAAEQRKKMTVDGGGTSQRLPSANGGTHSMSSEAPEPTPEPPTEVVDPSGSATETS